MPKYRYLLIGGGMTADAAAHGIREVDPEGSIGLISAEPDKPYDRPPLTKGLWKGTPVEKIWRDTESQAVDMHLGRTVERLDLGNKEATDNSGDVYRFEKLLLATGGRPRRLSQGGDEVIYYRSLADYRRLRGLTEKRRRFAVLGGGFIGSEIAASLAMNQNEVVMLFPGPSICSRVLPPDLCQFLNEFYRGKGVEVLNGDHPVAIDRRPDGIVMTTEHHHEITADGIVAGLGLELNVELALSAGLEVRKGIVVDQYLRTAHADVYAAGDVAEFYSPVFGRHLQVEHEDNANTMGRRAGRNMAGDGQQYDHIPFFYSDLFELGYEAVGELDPRLPWTADWKEPYREGVVYYHNEGRVRGMLLWNVWGQVDAARELIRNGAEPGTLKWKLKQAA